MIAGDLHLQSKRNIGIMAHIDAGKTTVTERMLFFSGRKHSIGEVHDGGATTDWMEQEKERGITITAAAINIEWTSQTNSPLQGETTQITIIDTPGHVDFTVEVERSLRVLDGAVLVLDGVSGVEPQSETVWRQANKYKVPRICFVNKLDRMGADFYKSAQSIKDKLGAKNSIIVSIPIGIEEDFEGIIDLVNNTAYMFKGLEWEESAIPEHMEAQAEKYRNSMLEEIAQYADDDFTMLFLEDPSSITVNMIHEQIRSLVCSYKIHTVSCGSAFKNKGVQLLLDQICNWLPSPLDVTPLEALNTKTEEREKILPSSKSPLCGIIFKIMSDIHVGRIFFVRLYSGTLKKGDNVISGSDGKKHRISKMIECNAGDRKTQISESSAGSICAVSGLTRVRTGDTICLSSHPYQLESMTFPDPVISMAITPNSLGDREKLSTALGALTEEDPTFITKTNEETGQVTIAGMGELHLEINVDRMKREFGVLVDVSKPEVSYRETITKTGTANKKYAKQSGGRGQYAHMVLEVQPADPGAGITIVSKIVGGAIPKEYIPAAIKGIEEGLTTGVIAGYPTVDLSVKITDGTYHDVDSSEMAFKLCGSMAIKEAVSQAKPIILEPYMKNEVTSTEEHLGTIMGDISRRRGRVLGQNVVEDGSTAKTIIVTSEVPLSELFGYSTDLRSLTSGRASYSITPSHFEKVPAQIQEKIESGKKV
ncbi:MAG: elongation factor G [Chlamydiia bacterium]|nr:elongation factor G [Chlamydiia bacterium]